MKRLVVVGVAAAFLAGAGLALADEFDSKAVKAVTATFTATTVKSLKKASCTNGDGTWTNAAAEYSGMALSSDSTLNGPVTLRLRSVINTTRDLGRVQGSLRIDTPSTDTIAEFDGVYAGGKVVGLAEGRTGQSPGRLLANLSASFSQTAGLTSGKIGGADGGAALVFAPGTCGRK